MTDDETEERVIQRVIERTTELMKIRDFRKLTKLELKEFQKLHVGLLAANRVRIREWRQQHQPVDLTASRSADEEGMIN